MFRIAILLLFLSGCPDRSTHSGQVVSTSSGAIAPAQLAVGEPTLVDRLAAFRSGSENSGSHIMEWSDSIRRGDTAYFARGRLVTTNVVYIDSQWMRVPVRPLPAGIPVGLFGTWNGIEPRPNSEVFTLTYGNETPATLMTRIAAARSRGVKMVIAMTGGARGNYLTSGVFDMAKWRARLQAFDTPEIRSAVAQAVADGILIGNSVMDEPFNDGGPGNESNSWGPKGTMTKARVDSMCGYAKSIFPMLPQGVFQDYRLAPDDSYMVCDFVTSQYRMAKGSVTAYRAGALELCRRDHHACSFGINVLDGGIPVRRQPGQNDYLPGDCPLTTTGGRGTYFPNCRMTPEQVREAGRVLGSVGCFLTGFRYDADFVSKPENQAAFRDVIATLATMQTRGCIRS
jgi:hypothetical protein